MKVLSIRQPWAWLIIHAGKDIENRTWKTNFRGPVYIHASLTLDVSAMRSLETLCYPNPIPKERDFARGEIIGTVEVVDCVTESNSPWFAGPFGFVLKNPKPISPTFKIPGRLGFFEMPEVKLV